MNNIVKIEDYLKNTPAFFLSTIHNNKPKCRPIGLHLLLNDKLYFGVGTFKEVYQQMQENPYVEITSARENDWLRYYGKAVFEKNSSIAQIVLDDAPNLKEIYNETTGCQLGIFHLEEATAEFRSMMKVEESYHF